MLTGKPPAEVEV